VEVPDHSQGKPASPVTLDWDLWLGVAESREFDPCYLPFNWRGYWDFGTGALGDMGCHLMSGAYWALDLTAPTSVEAAGGPRTEVSPPKSAVITYEFPARRGLPPVKWTWYDGGMQPPAPAALEAGRSLLARGGTLIIGSKATVMADENYQGVRIIPEARMKELAPKLPAKTIPRIPGGDHLAEWINACKGGTPAGSNFEHASALTETVLLGNVALRAGRRIEWDSARLQVTNFPSANHYVTKQYRPGFGV
jgi:predicted dehydrogenase